MTITELFEYYVAASSMKRPEVRRQQAAAVLRHLGDVECEELSVTRLLEYRKARAADAPRNYRKRPKKAPRPISDSTINREMASSARASASAFATNSSRERPAR